MSRFSVFLILIGVLSCADSDLSDEPPDLISPTSFLDFSTPPAPDLTYGTSETFASADGLALVQPHYVVVLDRMDKAVRLFSREGTALSNFGRIGDGPGEFRNPAAIAATADGRIFVLDSSLGRLTGLEVEGDSLVQVSEDSLGFQGMDMCAVANDLFVMGVYEGFLVHQTNPEGRVLRSFAPVPEGDPFDVTIASVGWMACSANLSRLALVPRQVPQVRLFSLAGEEIMTDSIPEFVGTIYERVGNAVRPQAPPEGFVHSVTGATWLPDGLLIQLDRGSRRGSSSFESRWLGVDGVWITELASWPKILGRSPAGEVFASVADPFPVVRRYSLHKQQVDPPTRDQ